MPNAKGPLFLCFVTQGIHGIFPTVDRFVPLRQTGCHTPVVTKRNRRSPAPFQPRSLPPSRTCILWPCREQAGPEP